jgi:hypothetical protein
MDFYGYATFIGYGLGAYAEDFAAAAYQHGGGGLGEFFRQHQDAFQFLAGFEMGFGVEIEAAGADVAGFGEINSVVAAYLDADEHF